MGQAFPVSAFKEKPNREVAESYLMEGGYYWNAGIFALTIETLYAELRNHFAEIEPFLTMDYQTLLSRFAELPSISFDFAVMEKTDRAVVIPLDVQWSDVGSWDSIYEMLPKDDVGNVIQGNVIADGTTGSLLVNKTDRPLAVSGFSQIIAIQTQDGFLLTNMGESQKIGQIQNQLQPQMAILSPV
jgi:mannose-1-phosphate guanylyltransferase/mannose-6-phosphate isomerase